MNLSFSCGYLEIVSYNLPESHVLFGKCEAKYLLLTSSFKAIVRQSHKKEKCMHCINRAPKVDWSYFLFLTFCCVFYWNWTFIVISFIVAAYAQYILASAHHNVIGFSCSTFLLGIDFFMLVCIYF